MKKEARQAAASDVANTANTLRLVSTWPNWYIPAHGNER